jgi:hypothetical protein
MINPVSPASATRAFKMAFSPTEVFQTSSGDSYTPFFNQKTLVVPLDETMGVVTTTLSLQVNQGGPIFVAPNLMLLKQGSSGVIPQALSLKLNFTLLNQLVVSYPIAILNNTIAWGLLTDSSFNPSTVGIAGGFSPGGFLAFVETVADAWNVNSFASPPFPYVGFTYPPLLASSFKASAETSFSPSLKFGFNFDTVSFIASMMSADSGGSFQDFVGLGLAAFSI